MILSGIFRILLRLATLASAVVSLALASWFLDKRVKVHSNIPRGRLIYTDVVAVAAVLTSLVLFFPFHIFFLWEFILSLAFFAAFGALANFNRISHCGGPFAWHGLTGGAVCDKWHALEAFVFISACLWFLGTIFSAYCLHKQRRARADGTYQRRGFFGRSKV